MISSMQCSLYYKLSPSFYLLAGIWIIKTVFLPFTSLPVSIFPQTPTEINRNRRCGKDLRQANPSLLLYGWRSNRISNLLRAPQVIRLRIQIRIFCLLVHCSFFYTTPSDSLGFSRAFYVYYYKKQAGPHCVPLEPHRFSSEGPLSCVLHNWTPHCKTWWGQGGPVTGRCLGLGW